MQKFCAVLFDLDGTLVNSAPDIANATQHMLSQLGLPHANTQDIKRWVGNGLTAFIKRALTGEMDGEPSSMLLQKASPIFLNYYQKNICVDSYLYPGAIELLSTLKNAGISLAIITNKATDATLELLKQIDLINYFDIILCGDSCTHKKPHPELVLTALKQFNLPSSEALMVGDSTNDIYAANAAKVPALVVDYGYAQGADLHALNTIGVISNLNEISNFV